MTSPTLRLILPSGCRLVNRERLCPQLTELGPRRQIEKVYSYPCETKHERSATLINAAWAVGISSVIALICATARACSRKEEKEKGSEQQQPET